MKCLKFYFLLIFLGSSIFSYAQDFEYLLPAKRESKWGFIDQKGTWVIQPQFQEAFQFTEGLAAVKFYDNWGYIDKNGDWIIQPRFSDAKPFSEGLACAMSDNLWGYIDHTGAWHFEPKIEVVSSFSDGMALIKSEEGYVFVNEQGQKTLPYVFDKALPFAEGIAFVVYDGFKGYIDRSGNWLIKHDYTEAYSFSEGLALVKTQNGYGFIDRSGKLLISDTYEDGGYFAEGLAAVGISGRWGYIDKTGNLVIEPRFQKAYPFSNGLAVVRYGGNYGLIDQSGDWILNPVYGGLRSFTNASSMEEEVQKLVESKFIKWQLKGEFEKTEDYYQRVSEVNRNRQIDQFTHEAINELAVNLVHLNRSSLGLYDADLEKFSVYIPGAKAIMLPVPIGLAPEVQNNWKEAWLGNAQFSVNGDEFVVLSLEVKFKGECFYYDAKSDQMLGPNPTLDLNFENISVNMPIIPLAAKNIGKGTSLTVMGHADVDIDVPLTNIKNPKTFAVVIGNEDYTSFQMDLSPGANVEYAAIDAKIFNQYLVKTLGIPQENIKLLINATSGQMRQAIAKLSAIAKAFDGEARLIFYYAGHGLPDLQTHEPYLIPVDVNSNNLAYAIKLDDVYNKLTENNSERVTVFLDACFSGGGRDEGLLATRGVRIKPKSPFVMGNMVVFSAADGDQAAHPYREEAHGMFTYFLLKGLQISQGQITYGELADFVHTYVKRKSVLVNDVEQEPDVKVSPIFESTWKNMTFLPMLASGTALEN